MVLLGIVLAVALASLVVCIASSINGITFPEQIIQWANNFVPATKDVVETIANTPIA